LPSAAMQGTVVMGMVAPESAPDPADGCVVEDLKAQGFEILDAKVRKYFTVRNGTRMFFKVQEKLAEGDTAYVYHALELSNNLDLECALKMAPVHGTRLDVIHEDLKTLRGLTHPNILACSEHFIHAVKGTPFFCFSMDFCRKGTLGQYLHRKAAAHRTVSTATIASIVAQAADALEYCHRRDHLHGDLTSDHILLTEDNQVKLRGFGLPTVRRKLHAPTTITGGGRLYAPPEWADSAFLGRPLAPLEVPLPSYDLWSLGCVLTEMCTLRFLEDRIGEQESLALHDTALAGAVEEAAASHGGAFRRLVAGLLHPDPDERPTARAAAAEARAIARAKTSWITTLARSIPTVHALRGR